jgi:hypothetical protein
MALLLLYRCGVQNGEIVNMANDRTDYGKGVFNKISMVDLLFSQASGFGSWTEAGHIRR